MTAVNKNIFGCFRKKRMLNKREILFSSFFTGVVAYEEHSIAWQQIQFQSFLSSIT